MNLDIIKCPTCGAEYLASEIFLPSEFFGSLHEKVIKDENHRIIFPDKCLLNLKEEYECDYCYKKFIVLADIKFDAKEKKEIDFSEDYVTKIKKNDIFMVED